MHHVPATSFLPLLLVGLLLGGCGDGPPPDPAAADTTHGAAVDATDAIPAPAVAAEPNRYVGRRVTVDGRIERVAQDGCAVYLHTDGGPPLRVDAARDSTGPCAWQLPPGSDGIAAATGPLRADGDTLRLPANGVQVTPVRISETDS